ncbi:NEW3 domain-containing protein [Massilia sp. 9096]|uniref:NEW3 domain-containing protein n=1 Tax=Massilia sp. 9096 TaxID=1500894 RepID=UPI00056D1187|nr:NEW3 domain-containing protein [Massilia sp. 9096]
MNPRLTVVAAAVMFAAAHGAQAATAAGTQITNTASATYLDAALGAHTATSNTVITTVQQVASLSVGPNEAKNAAAGTQVVYAQSVTNTGNGSDSFNLTAANSGAYAMANVQFFADANGDGVADNATPITSTGPLSAGTTFRYVAVATLPGSASVGSTNAMVVTATSVFNGAISAAATDTTTVTAASTIDITANSAGSSAPGAGPGVESSPVVTNITTAGSTTRFTLYLNNMGGSADTFNLAASTDGSFGSISLPSGWTVVFKDASGAVITSSTVNPGASNVVYADVTPAAGATVGTTDLYFRALSPTSGVSDRIHDAVTIAANAIQVTLTKVQAIDANCDGVADTAFSSSPITTGAIPGACIRYQITATNSGATPVNTVVINDNVPANTTYHASVAANSTLGAVVAPVAGTTGVVSANVGVLSPGQSATMNFGVRINP